MMLFFLALVAATPESALVRLLSAYDAQLSEAQLNALCPDATALLLTVANDAAVPLKARGRALQWAAVRDAPRASGVAVSLLANDDPGVRTKALQTMRWLSRQQTFRRAHANLFLTLTPLLDDQDRFVRAACVTALASWPQARVSLAAHMNQESDPGVRDAIGKALAH